MVLQHLGFPRGLYFVSKHGVERVRQPCSCKEVRQEVPFNPKTEKKNEREIGRPHARGFSEAQSGMCRGHLTWLRYPIIHASDSCPSMLGSFLAPPCWGLLRYAPSLRFYFHRGCGNCAAFQVWLACAALGAVGAGDGMVHCVELREGEVLYSSRYVRTTGWLEERHAGRPLFTGMKHKGGIGASQLRVALLNFLQLRDQDAPYWNMVSSHGADQMIVRIP